MKHEPGRTRLSITLMFLLAAVLLPLQGCFGGEQETETRTVLVELPVEPGNAKSTEPSISRDGHLVAFTSEATNLLKTSTFGRNVFLKNVDTGLTSLISTNEDGIEGNGDSWQPAISADGRYVAFASSASDLVGVDTNDLCVSAGGVNINCVDVFRRDIEAGTVQIVSVDGVAGQGDGYSREPAISADGNLVAFTSAATNFSADDANEASDVFIKDLAAGTLQIVSTDPAGIPGNGISDKPALSADGRFVAFSSTASDLVAGDVNGETDVFLRDVQSGAVTLVSSDSAGAQGNKASGYQALGISADGRFVVFESEADNLVEGDINDKRDIFLKDTQTGILTMVSTDAAGTQGDDDSFMSVAVSADGTMVFFNSNANNLVPGDTVNKTDIFRKNTMTGAIDLITTDSAGVHGDGPSGQLSITSDGFFVAFSSDAANLVLEDINGKTDVFRKELQTGEMVVVSNSTS